MNSSRSLARNSASSLEHSPATTAFARLASIVAMPSDSPDCISCFSCPCPSTFRRFAATAGLFISISCAATRPFPPARGTSVCDTTAFSSWDSCARTASCSLDGKEFTTRASVDAAS